MFFATALIWGFAFVAQKEGGAEMGALTFNGVRSWMAGGMLVGVCGSVISMNKYLKNEKDI